MTSSRCALLQVPWSTSSNFFFELYALEMPVFLPSARFVAPLVARLSAIWPDRWRELQVDINPAELFSSEASALERTLLWLPTTDYMQYPHVGYFDTLPQLVQALSTPPLEWFAARRDAMRAFNQEATARTLAWAAAVLQDLYA